MEARSEETNIAFLVSAKVGSVEPRVGCLGRIKRTRKRLQRSRTKALTTVLLIVTRVSIHE